MRMFKNRKDMKKHEELKVRMVGKMIKFDWRWKGR